MATLAAWPNRLSEGAGDCPLFQADMGVVMEYEVKREHLGDKPYMPGDKREAAPSDVAHLVRAGVLVEAKVDPPLEVKDGAKSKARK